MARYKKQISDPIHGTIGLTEVEARVVGTRAFQRLRSVRQLGLAHYVYPGADYSRFAHSLGACHVTGGILETLKDSAPAGVITDDVIQQHRLAALLHDVGHYPFSHSAEDAIKDHYSQTVLEGHGGTAGVPQQTLDHMDVGAVILSDDPEVRGVLEAAGVKPSDVSDVFTRRMPLNPSLANIISSDLDADRIDYLRRTAHHAGLPYGAVDIEYLMTQMSLDKCNRLCVRAKALRAADHLLLCRYFDYQSVAYHKAVAGFEWVLRDVIAELLRRDVLRCSKEEVEKLVATGDWFSFDDAAVIEHIRRLRAATDLSAVVKDKIDAILLRRPVPVIYENEQIDARDKKDPTRLRVMAEMVVEDMCKTFGIEHKRVHTWHLTGRTITKVGSHVPVGDALDEEDMIQEVRILGDDGNSQPIVKDPRSLMSVLGDRALYAVRVYAVVERDQKVELSRFLKEKLEPA